VFTYVFPASKAEPPVLTYVNRLFDIAYFHANLLQLLSNLRGRLVDDILILQLIYVHSGIAAIPTSFTDKRQLICKRRSDVTRLIYLYFLATSPLKKL